MKKAIIWPPVDTHDYGGTAAAAAYFSWFFGDVFDRIILPVVKKTKKEAHSSYSVGALRNLHKVGVTSNPDNAEALKGVTHVLCTQKNITSLPKGCIPSKMTGSEAVELPKVEGKSNAKYYFVGNPQTDSHDAYLCVTFTYWHQGGVDKAFLEHSQNLLTQVKASLPKGQAASVFGTGPSLQEVNPKNHSLDASVICNTIVKNKSFCRDLNIAAIVASDCHFHFSCNQYAFQFLSDLKYQLENSNAIYVTFDKFAAFVLAKFPELREKTCGIPAGRTSFGFDLDKDFRTFPGESVVNMFMLPVACFLSDKIRLCGFTGRAPDDSYFWGHADDFQYKELMQAVRDTHPAFFADRDYDGYANTVGEQLSSRAQVARESGVQISSVTTSFYKGLEYDGQ